MRATKMVKRFKEYSYSFYYSFISGSQSLSHCHQLVSLCHYQCQKKSLTLHSSHHHHLILASFGTLSTSFFIANQRHNFHLPLISNLYQACLHPSSLTKFSKFILLLSRVLPTPHPHTGPSHIPTDLTFFSPATEDEICKLLSQSSNTFCDLDPIPTALLKHCLPALLSTITNIVNLSLSSGVFPKQFKLCSVIPLLKKYNPDKEDLSNYRPISHLSFLSKLTEWLVKLCLTHQLSSNDLLNSFQSAYTKYPFNRIHTSFRARSYH